MIGKSYWLSGFAFGGAGKLVLVDHDWPTALFLLVTSLCMGLMASRFRAQGS